MSPIEMFTNIREHPKVYGIPAHYRGEAVVKTLQKGYTKFKDTLKDKSKVENKNIDDSIMPRYQKKKKQTKRRRKILKAIPSAPFPNQIVRKLKTSQFYDTQAHTSGALEAFVWRLNDLADPEGTFGTQQALGFDQYSAIYRKYCVIGAKLTITAYDHDSNPFMVGCHINTDGTALTSYEHYKELKNTSSRVLSPDVDHITWSHKVSMPKLFRKKKLITNEDEYGGKLAAHSSGLSSPSQLAYAHIWAQPMNQYDTTTAGVYFSITMEQIVVFYDYETPSRSAV